MHDHYEVTITTIKDNHPFYSATPSLSKTTVEELKKYVAEMKGRHTLEDGNAVAVSLKRSFDVSFEITKDLERDAPSFSTGELSHQFIIECRKPLPAVGEGGFTSWDMLFEPCKSSEHGMECLQDLRRTKSPGWEFRLVMQTVIAGEN